MRILHSYALLLFVAFRVSAYVANSASSNEWNIMKLTQSWPPAACIFVENEDQKCNITSSIQSWVIHGLWPTESGTQGPNFCNVSWKFDLDEVQTLRPRLDYNWPSIILGKTPEESWKHEWEKHGTCGATLAAISDELLYFNQTLGLHVKFNISQILAQGGVLPSSTKKYNPKDIQTILNDYLGFNPSITCVKEKKTENFYLEQVEVCLDKSFSPVDCDSRTPRKSSTKDRPHDLLFMPEDLVQGRDIQDCGSGDVYYKPLPAQKIVKS